VEVIPRLRPLRGGDLHGHAAADDRRDLGDEGVGLHDGGLVDVHQEEDGGLAEVGGHRVEGGEGGAEGGYLRLELREEDVEPRYDVRDVGDVDRLVEQRGQVRERAGAGEAGAHRE
jgi:hypothetical protein